MSEANEIVAPEETRSGFLVKAARPIELLLGLVFLASALLKAADITGFIIAIGLYGVVTGDSAQTVAALVTLAIESALGTALVLGWRPRALTFGGAIALLVAFSGLILYGWIVHDISDCGCSGAIKMGPGQSLIKNAVLLALAVTALLGFRKKAVAGFGVPLTTVAALVCAAAVTGYAYTQIEPPPQQPPPQTGPFAQFVFEVDGRPVDLGKGKYFVALLNSTCEHCMASVEKLNQLAEIPNFPPVLALGDGDPESFKEFNLITGPQFPVHPIDRRTFSTLIDKFPPRFILVRDGRSVQTWDNEVPSPEQVVQAMQESSPASG